MKANQKTQRRGFTLVELLVVIVIIASLAGLTAPMVIRQRKKADQTEATSNARQIGLAMFEFETDYGTFPDSSTATMVNNNNPNHGFTLGTSTSNDYFRQLFAANITQSEAMFFVKTPRTVKPDGVITPGSEALKAGENGFGYILNASAGLSTAGNPARVIACTPMLTATTFDSDPFDKKAVVLRIDNSVASLNINQQNQAMLGGGQQLLVGGSGTIWDSITPTVVLPQPRAGAN
jgi:prepilin-type N-terminal cleavage/methylation domain-containing protein